MDSVCDPEFIQFQNTDVSKKKRFFNRVSGIMIMFAIIYVSSQFIYIFKQLRSQYFSQIITQLGEKGYTNLGCQDTSISKEQAYKQMLTLENKKQLGNVDQESTFKMFCFCQNKYFNGTDVSTIEFSNGKNYCKQWYSQYKFIVFLEYLPTALIASLNIITQFLFLYLAEKEGHIIKTK